MGLQGHSPAKAVQGISTDHLSYLVALYVTSKWLYRPSLAPKLCCQVALVKVTGSFISKSCPGDMLDHLSHLAALEVTPKCLQTLPGLKNRLLGGQGQGYGVIHQTKLSRGLALTISAI